jgi:hypothetical protein
MSANMVWLPPADEMERIQENQHRYRSDSGEIRHVLLSPGLPACTPGCNSTLTSDRLYGAAAIALVAFVATQFMPANAATPATKERCAESS